MFIESYLINYNLGYPTIIDIVYICKQCDDTNYVEKDIDGTTEKIVSCDCIYMDEV